MYCLKRDKVEGVEIEIQNPLTNHKRDSDTPFWANTFLPRTSIFNKSSHILEKEAISLHIMPIPLVAEVFQEGLSKIPYAYTVLKTLPWCGGIYGLKRYFAGALNHSERNMHSKVVIMTVSYQNLKIRRVLITNIRAEHQA